MGEAPAFKPVRKIKASFDEGRSAAIYIDANGCFGMIFCNSEGEETRCQLSPEASDATLMAMQALKAGGGDLIEYEWRVIKAETLVQEAKT